MKSLLSFILILLLPFITKAQLPIRIDGSQKIIDLGRESMYYYEDKSKILQIEQVSSPDFQQNFQSFPSKILNLGTAKYPTWIKIIINLQTNQDYYLQIDNPYLDSVFFYFPSPSGEYQIKITGKKLPVETEDIASTHCILAIPKLLLNQEQVFYLKLISNRYMHVEARIIDKQNIINSISRRYIVELAYFGIILLAIIYNLFVYFSVRDASFLYYVIYTFFVGLNIFNTRGFLTLFFSDYREIISKYSFFISSLFIIFAIVFTIHFLKVRQYSSLWFRILLFLLGLAILRTFLTYIGYGQILFSSGIVFLTVNLGIFITVGIVVYRKKYKPALFYLTSWGIFAFFTFWASLAYTGSLPFNSFSKYLSPLGTALETIFTALALADRINVLKNQNIELIKTQNELLEKEVRRRTKKLEANKKAIETQNEELQQQQEELRRINEHLEEKNQEIERQNEELSQQKIALEGINYELEKVNSELRLKEAVIKEQNAELAHKQVRMIVQNEKLFRQKKEIEALKNNLEKLVAQRTKELQQTLDDLTRQNQDLSQFSFIISHNLRAPVARILGLLNIFNEGKYEDEDNKQIISLLRKTATDLDTVIRDLTKIISIRNDLNKTKEKVYLPEIIAHEKFVLKNEIEQSNAIIDAEYLEIQEIFSVKSYVQSIISNLLSNAIKYKSQKRNPIICLKTYSTDGFICLSVQDNGLGIDLTNIDIYKVFGLYQRMHDHVEGKGMGLFLVKTQIESLGGKVEIESHLDIGTTFYVYFPV